jgi:hypothetical protein
MRTPAQVRDAVAPAWLIEAVRPGPAPVPVGLMVRAALAICVPLAVGFAVHQPALGLLPAIGGLLASVVDIGGRATVWWPAVAALEEVMDAITAAAVAADHGMPPSPPQQIRELIAVLQGIADAERSGVPPQPARLAADENPGPVADAVRRVPAALS